MRRWLGHLWREWTIESWRPVVPAFAKPEPLKWNDAEVTAAWIGHATVLINFFGIKILTDPVLFPRVGIRLPGLTIGPKRLTAPALEFHELPRIDLILLSHAHFDHFDLRTLHRFNKDTSVITAPNTADLLRWTRLRDITELRWGETKVLNIASQTKGNIGISAFQVKHWGARMQRDTHRGYNGYLIESRSRGRRRILFGGDTAMTDTFAKLGPIDLAIMSIGAYNPWIRTIARRSRRLKWPTLPVRNLSCRCIIKRSGSVSSHCGNPSNASRPRSAILLNASRCAKLVRLSFCRDP